MRRRYGRRRVARRPIRGRRRGSYRGRRVRNRAPRAGRIGFRL